MHRLLHDESILFADNDREIFDKRRTFYESIPNSAEWLHTGNLFLLQLVDETIEVHQETSNRLPNVRHPGRWRREQQLPERMQKWDALLKSALLRRLRVLDFVCPFFSFGLC